MHPPKSIKPFGPHAILIEWEEKIDAAIFDSVIAYETAILGLKGLNILETVPTYASIAVFLQPDTSIQKTLSQFNSIIPENSHALKSTWQIPVCYHESLGIDLAEISSLSGMTRNEIVAMHSATKYQFYFNGFLPGFMYLAGLNEKLFIPRKKTPRLRIPKGAVAIGGNQTGIYPADSPGGWHIIGRTKSCLFNVELSPPTPFLPGDYIQFKPITLDEFNAMENDLKLQKIEQS